MDTTGKSICIPAFNEERTISALLRDLIEHHLGADDEVLVCANGCTDTTADRVAGIGRNDSRVQLIKTDLGKPLAWNTLFERASRELLVFIDADLRIKWASIARLGQTLLDNPRLICASGIALPDPVQKTSRNILPNLASQPFVHDYVYGGLYALRRSSLLERFHQIGLSPPYMPLNLIADDLWLELVMGKDGFKVVRDAVAYYRLDSFSDVIKSRARLQVARQQIATRWPELYAERKEDRASKVKLLRDKLTTDSPLREKLIGLGGTSLRFSLLWLRSEETRKTRAAMERQLAADRGHEVLSDSGRIAAKERGAGSLLIFLHIVKTGGTTLRWVLEDQFPGDRITRCYESLGDTLEQIERLSENQKRETDLFVTHYGFGTHTLFPQPSTYVTMVREPISRSVSQFYQFVYEQDPTRQAQIADYIERMPETRSDNVQVRYISGSIDEDSVDDTHLERALGNLDSHFAAVGIMERFDESLALFCKLFGWRGLTYVRRNKGKSRPADLELPPKLREKIEAYNALDIKLYEHCRERFTADLNRHGITEDYVSAILKNTPTARARLYLTRSYRKLQRKYLGVQ